MATKNELLNLFWRCSDVTYFLSSDVEKSELNKKYK